MGMTPLTAFSSNPLPVQWSSAPASQPRGNGGYPSEAIGWCIPHYPNPLQSATIFAYSGSSSGSSSTHHRNKIGSSWLLTVIRVKR